MMTDQNYFQISGKDQVSNLTVFRVPTSAPEEDGEFIISITGSGPSGSLIITDTDAGELLRQLAGLICSSETERLRTLNEGQELKPLSLPLQNLLKHIQDAAVKNM